MILEIVNLIIKLVMLGIGITYTVVGIKNEDRLSMIHASIWLVGAILK